MKITGYGSISSAGPANKRRGTSSTGGFADVLASAEAPDASQAGATSDVAAAAALNNLLALQEISEEDVQRRKLAQHGSNILDVLEKLRRQLLGGSLSLHLLRDINRQLSIQKQVVNDPQLNSVIEDIELRAAVELAKLEQALAARD